MMGRDERKRERERETESVKRAISVFRLNGDGESEEREKCVRLRTRLIDEVVGEKEKNPCCKEKKR